MDLSPQKITAFQTHILDWYRRYKRDLPWRHTRDPYKILVSEVMSQQTQISRVVPKYEAWINTFPTIEDLAAASVRDVLKLWSGLGYNRRALYLQKCAQTITEKYGGEFPQDEKTLLSLPGIGKYTARAVCCFAYDKQIAVVDTNVKKVILTQLVRKEHLPEKDIEEIAERILPHGNAYEWNQALMDYAGANLKKEKISIPKQSKFKDSDRFVRGTILKILLADHMLSKDMLYQKIQTKMQMDEKRFSAIVTLLKKDGLIVEKREMISLP